MTMDNWTYCKDALPEKEGKFIVSFITRDKNPYTTDSYFYDGVFHDGFYHVDNRVYAWMPLPAPAEVE